MMPQRSLPRRTVIYPKDVEKITGLKGRTSRKLLLRIKKAFGKTQHQLVSIPEFCAYTGLNEELVLDYLND